MLWILIQSYKGGQLTIDSFYIKKARNDRNISQLALSTAIGHKAVGTVSMAELYLNEKHFNIEHLVKIANVLDMDACEFFKDENG